MRFVNSGAAFAGSHCPAGPFFDATDDTVNLGYFASPPETFTQIYGGAVIRVALNIPNGREQFVGIIPLGDVQPNQTVYFISACPSMSDVGTVAATFAHPSPVGFDWALVDLFPEPANVWQFVPLSIWLFRRRR